jgi:hypothetical protein
MLPEELETVPNTFAGALEELPLADEKAMK